MRQETMQAIEQPDGKWVLVGRVPVDLCYVRNDGGDATEDDYREVHEHGMSHAHMRRRTWDTEQQAEHAMRS